LQAIGSVLTEVPNRLTLEGHTDSDPYSGGDRGYSNWELSSDRANASRRELIAGGLADDRILRVQGLASSQPFEAADPRAPSNRRISIIVMNREAEDRMFRQADEAAESSTDGATAADAPAAGASSGRDTERSRTQNRLPKRPKDHHEQSLRPEVSRRR